MVYTIALNASYEIKSCLLLNDLMLLSCIYFFLIGGWMSTKGSGGGDGGPNSNFELTISVAK